jgi:hypothetical protein
VGAVAKEIAAARSKLASGSERLRRTNREHMRVSALLGGFDRAVAWRSEFIKEYPLCDGRPSPATAQFPELVQPYAD